MATPAAGVRPGQLYEAPPGPVVGQRHGTGHVLGPVSGHGGHGIRLSEFGYETLQPVPKGPGGPGPEWLAQVRRLGHGGVARAIALLAEADLALKGVVEWPPELVLEVLVARLSHLWAAR